MYAPTVESAGTGPAGTGDFTAQFARYAGDRDHHGTFEFYPEFRALLQDALASATAFDTGWVGVKKEIMSIRLRCTRPTGSGARAVKCRSATIWTRRVTVNAPSPGRGYHPIRPWRNSVRGWVRHWMRQKHGTDQTAHEEYVGICVGHAGRSAPGLVLYAPVAQGTRHGRGGAPGGRL